MSGAGASSGWFPGESHVVHMTHLTSRRHDIVARFRDAALHPGSWLLLDGPHLVGAALDAGVRIDVAVVRAGTDGRAVIATDPLVGRLLKAGSSLVSATATVMEALSPVRTPSGIVALAERPASDARALLAPPPALILVAADVQDPGNVGAIIRAADAAGATGVVTTLGCADPFGWKALRGAMGSTFHLPVWSRAAWPDVVAFMRRERVRVLAAAPRAAASLFDLTWDAPTAVLVGAEGLGLPAWAPTVSELTFAVPMRAHVDSLNVAVSAGLIAYEAGRKRGRLG